MKRTAACVLVVSLLFCFSRVSAFAEKIDKIIAIVNEDIITEDELNQFVKLTAPKEASMLSEADLAELKKMLLERMIEDRLILQKAKKEGLKPNPKMIDDRISQIKEKAGSEKAFQDALRSEGLSLNELREKLENQYLIFTAIDLNVKNKIKISPKEVTDYFIENRDKFNEPEKALVDSIFVSDRETLDKVLKELKEGADFNKVSEKYSEKLNIKEVRRKELKKELEDFVFQLKPGSYSPPFSLDGGYYIFRVKKFIKPSSLTLDEVKDSVTTMLENEKMQAVFKEWVESLKDNAYISIRQ